MPVKSAQNHSNALKISRNMKKFIPKSITLSTSILKLSPFRADVYPAILLNTIFGPRSNHNSHTESRHLVLKYLIPISAYSVRIIRNNTTIGSLSLPRIQAVSSALTIMTPIMLSKISFQI